MPLSLDLLADSDRETSLDGLKEVNQCEGVVTGAPQEILPADESIHTVITFGFAKLILEHGHGPKECMVSRPSPAKALAKSGGHLLVPELMERSACTRVIGGIGRVNGVIVRGIC